MTCTVSTPSATLRYAKRRFRLVFSSLALAAVFAGSAAPTPLYRTYQEELSLSPALLTIIFGAYALALLLTLLTIGSLSDVIGRRPVIAISLVVTAFAMGLFALDPSPASLIGARLLQGVANGLAIGALGAELLDADLARGPFINSVVPFAGMSAGALFSGLLVTYGSHPTKLVYVLMMIAFVGLAAAALGLPASPRTKRWSLALLVPRLAIPAKARRTFWRVSLVNASAWALGGYFLSLMPSLIRQTLNLQSPLIGAGVVSILALTAAAAIAIVRPYPLRRITAVGEIAFLSGIALTLAGLSQHVTALLFLGSSTAGFGMGACFFAASRELLPLAANHERVALLSAFYTESYLAFSLPVVFVGIAAPLIGLAATTYWFGAVLAALATISFVLRELDPLNRRRA